MKFKYMRHAYCNNQDVELQNKFNKLNAPYCNTYVQLTINNMYVTWIKYLNTYDMGIAITRMLDLKITSTS